MAAGGDAYLGEGSPHPLGVTLTADGVNVAVYSDNARVVEFCLFDEAGETEIARTPLRGRTGPVFHGQIAAVRAGARYGLRAYGPFAPHAGHRFNPNKLLVDPYALALDRPFDLRPSMYAYRPGDPAGADSFDETDSASATPKAIVTRPPASPPLVAPGITWAETVIYELHVRGFTMTHPDIPQSVRGTFAGLAHPAAIAHLRRLGVTTVELMPCAAWIDERHLGPIGLTNYWGYNPVALMVPDPRLAPGGWAEVRTATDALAAAGIECVLDVVLNHTGEGDALGPTVSLRGLDNAAYYRLHADDAARYVDDSGTGNALALDRPAPLRLAMDALRAWRRYGGMSGFRFDLATALGRRPDGFDPAAPLLSAIEQDPELSALKLIAEPWDVGPGGYQLGRFPAAWGEWNDRFRDAVRRFWRGDGVSLGELARRMAGSQDLLGRKRPSRSVNFVVSHDGFTLADLVAFTSRRNLANGEDGRDGADDNRSWNNGVEGATDDAAVRKARQRDQRALLALPMAARGTPMLAMGAELGHSQGGNNNAYAQDSAVSWLDWAGADEGLIAFAAKLAGIRRSHPALRADRFLTGEAERSVHADVVWRRADGSPLEAADWDAPDGPTLVMTLAEPDGRGLDRVVVIIHRAPTRAGVTLPEPRDGFAWTLLADSADEGREGEVETPAVEAAPRSVLILAEAHTARVRRTGVDARVLARLAQNAGIAHEWHDLDGGLHRVSTDTLASLLDAMRWPAGSTEQALNSLQGFAEFHERRPLPHAIVRRVGRPAEVPLWFDPGGRAPHTWLVIESADGQSQRLRLRASPQTGIESAVRGADGRSGRHLVVTTPPLQVGRYRLMREDRPDVSCSLTVAPPSSFVPDALRDGRRLFGLAAQLYSVRRPNDQGIGDFTTLGDLGEVAAREGAAAVAINPLHALFCDQRERASPYHPSDRRFLDPIYLDLDRLAGAADIALARHGLSNLASIDYPAVWTLKSAVLEAAFAKGVAPGLDGFIAAGGEPLAAFATFQAVAESRPGQPWTSWPAELRDPAGPAVRAFAASHAGRVRFHQYLQWLCERQLAEAATRCDGLSLGLCRDLAVGAAPDGAEAWASADLVAQGVSIGAPPDPFSAGGQVWGLPPFDPLRLGADGYAHVSNVLARNMRHAGALRIDHVMGLARLFWVPRGAGAADGAYVSYPLGDLLGQVALESTAARCLVIGEDLGTPPEGLRDALREESILSYRVLPFERDAGRFRPPEAYPRLALACASTHDLPPIAGWWEGVDIAELVDLGLMSPASAERALLERLAERLALIEALRVAALIEAGADAAAIPAEDVMAEIHAFIARTPSFLAMAQLADLAGERVAVNLPGTDRERPNWRRRIATPLGDILQTPAARAVLRAVRESGRGY